MDGLNFMERFADPALFDTLTRVELLKAGLVTTLMGVGTTFLVLSLIWLSIASMGRILHLIERIKNKESVSVSTLIHHDSTMESSASHAEEISPEVIAVITAAILAAEGKTAIDDGLVIRKINRVAGTRPSWGRAGMIDCMESRRF
ncbi:MAG: OadG family protein [Eubacteriales bacterium]|nr:OadG family protein [Eubacteriales bacterium]